MSRAPWTTCDLPASFAAPSPPCPAAPGTRESPSPRHNISSGCSQHSHWGKEWGYDHTVGGHDWMGIFLLSKKKLENQTFDVV